MSIEAMRQALEALQTNNKAWKHLADSGDAGFWEAEEQPFYEASIKAITVLRAAIEEAETPEKRRERVDHIRIRIMQEAYDLADRDDSEGYNSVKVMCSEVLGMIDRLLDERQWQGLTDEEIDAKTDFRATVRYFEAKLKEKNT